MSFTPNPNRDRVERRAATWRRVRPTTQSGPRYGIVGSVAFHALIFAAALFSFHNFRTPVETHIVPVDLVTLAAHTNITPEAPPPPKVEPEKIDIPTPSIPVPPEPDLIQAEPAPTAQMPKFDVAKPKPTPEPKPRPKPKPEKPKLTHQQRQEQDFAALLNKVTKAPPRPKNAKTSDRLVQGVGAGNAMTADLADALQSQIYHCWSPPVGAPNADDLIVDYELRLNPDGTVGALRLLPGSAARASANSYTRAAAEAASRAVYRCAPYHLPTKDYALWRDINPLHFDPRQLMGQ